MFSMGDNLFPSFLSRHKRALNILLAAVGFIDLGFYYFCGDSCLYLAGTLLNIDLKIWGLLFLSAFLMISILKQELLICLLLSGGVGGEIFLVGYQIVNRTYCPFCLIFALIIVLLLIINAPSFINADKKQRSFILTITAALGLLVMSLFFQATPVGSSGLTLPKFGQGPISVRMYSDYFCGPCQKLEPDAEKILRELIKENKINLVIVDVPIHRHTQIYTSYYLALSQQEESMDKILHIRRLLFDAAQNKITDSQALAEYLTDHGLPKVTVSAEQSADLFRYIQEDGIDATPVIVIAGEKGKETHMGRTKILEALEALK